MKEIVDSFINGQYTQMVKQIDEFGVYEFASSISTLDVLSYSERVDILRIYLMRTHR